LRTDEKCSSLEADQEEDSEEAGDMNNEEINEIIARNWDVETAWAIVPSHPWQSPLMGPCCSQKPQFRCADLGREYRTSGRAIEGSQVQRV
jgi:hypothetical protein